MNSIFAVLWFVGAIGFFTISLFTNDSLNIFIAGTTCLILGKLFQIHHLLENKETDE